MTFTVTKRIEIPWKTLVVKADPDYEKLKRDELEYTFSGNRAFTSKNSNKRGPYGPPTMLKEKPDGSD